jgi:tetratricopeptide (TPR) repeat protein
MKALILNTQGHNEEAFALGKEALRNDMKSHVCWHVYGLLYRSQKNYEESIKAYKFALKLEPESQQIQRDLALLQIQMRDYSGYVVSRRTMLQARPQLRANWSALAIAQHLAGDLDGAEKTLTAYEESLKSPPSKSDIEHQEAILYKNTIIAEMGQTERALEHLDAATKTTYDKQAVMEMRAGYLLKLDRKEEAAKVYRKLLDRNADRREYYEGLIIALGLDESDTKARQELYTEYAEKSPRSDTPRRVPLDFLSGDEFKDAADKYLQSMLNKGVPSTFANIKTLYNDKAKQATIQELAESYAAGKHTPQANGSVKEEKSDGKPSQFETATLYFLAQHYDYYKSRDLKKASEAIEKALALAPESVDFNMTKARIFKHQGDIEKAAEQMEKARSVDERDRYINTKAAKYQLRNDENEAAIQNMGKFTRQEAVGGPLGDLIDMQCMWYLSEDGESYLRQSNLALALKRFTTVYNIFELWHEDQFDFHSFSIRKGQVRAYVELIRFEDNLREHPFFTRAAIGAIKAYILLHDQPELAKGAAVNGANGETADMSAQKKAAKKARKEEEKQKQMEAEKKDAKKTNQTGPDGEPKKEDKDPEGKLLVATKEPLKDAMKFLTPMLELSPKNLDAQKVGFELYLRRGKLHCARR